MIDRRWVLSHSCATLIACIATGLALPGDANADELIIKEFNPDAPAIKFGPEQLETELSFKILPRKVKRVTLIPVGTQLSDIEKTACVLDVVDDIARAPFDDPKCQGLYTHDSDAHWTISADNLLKHQILQFSAGPDSDLALEFPDTAAAARPDWSKITLPTNGTPVWLKTDRWRRYAVSDDLLRKQLLIALKAKGEPRLSLNIIDGSSPPTGRLVRIKATVAKMPPPKPVAWDLGTCLQFHKDNWARAAPAIAAPALRSGAAPVVGAGAASGQPTVEPGDQSAGQPTVEPGDQSAHYVVCVDYTDPNNARIFHFAAGRDGPEPRVCRGAERDAEKAKKCQDRRTTRVDFADSEPFHFYTNTPIFTYVLHARDKPVDVTFEGKVGYSSAVYDPSAKGEELAVGPAKIDMTGSTVTFHHSPPLLVDNATLVVKPRAAPGSNGAAETAMAYKNQFSVEARYRGAFRIGVGFSWSPMQFGYEARTSNSANPGRYIARSEGGGSSISNHFGIELMAGGSVFFRPVRDRWTRRDRPTGGWYFGVGLAEASTSGARVFSSFHTGPELVFGKEYSLALTFTLRRIEALKNGYYAGRSVGAEEKFTRPALGVGLSIVINFSPKLLSAIGKIGGVK